MTIGILREGKIPADKRVALTPKQCLEIKNRFGVEVLVQESKVRAISDQEYRELGLKLVDDISVADILIGVKEVPIEQLIPEKTYLFFSHTHKQQAYNRKLLQSILQKRITLIDYEVITDLNHHRLIGFGRYAGIVGVYNAFLAWGKKTKSYQLKPAHLCLDREEMEREIEKIVLPNDFKMVITGGGRVGSGALEILHKMPIRQVFPLEYLEKKFEEPVFTQLNVEDYYATTDGTKFVRSAFYKNPLGYKSNFMPYARLTDMYVPCHFWDNRSPFVFTREDAKQPDFKIKVVADISCDIDCAVASTIRSSTIANPHYGYNATLESEVDFMDDKAIGVMAVDNLPCELPRDASEDFGNELLKNVIPCLIGNDPDGIISRATITNKGSLSKNFDYLSDFVSQQV